MSSDRRIAAAALAVPLALVASRGPAAACSCVAWEPGLLAPPEVELPSNGRGLPWWGWLPAGAERTEGPPHAAFSVQRLDAGEAVDVPFVLEVLAKGPIFRSGPGAAEYVILVAPSSPLVPGGRYRFTYRYQGYPHQPPAAEVEDPQVVEVSVAREPLTPEEGSTLRIWKEERGDLQVAAGASCAERVDSHQIGVELDLAAGARRFKDALLFGVQLEGRGVWRYRPHLCAQDVPGTSRVGRGRELLYSVCSAVRKDLLGSGLPEGVYRVEMAAWLPGTEVTLGASREVLLHCEPEP